MKNSITIAFAVLLASSAAPALETVDDPYARTVDGVSVYLGVVPAEAPGEPDLRRHGGMPGARHVTVALYEHGVRLEDARVSAYLAVDRAKSERVLEPMRIAGVTTFGNEFSMPGAGPYEIRVEVRTTAHPRPRIATFRYTPR